MTTMQPLTPATAETPWHSASFDRFLLDRLPDLLGRRMPISNYRVTPQGETGWTVTLSLHAGSREVEVIYTDIPRPDADGIFTFKDRRLVVVPTASSDALETAEIRCAGEQLYAVVEARLGEAPEDLPWDEGLARSWLPLDTWVCEFLERSGQRLDETNWISARTHLRRIVLPERSRVFTPGHYGRVCPIETPEGPNIGRVLSVSLGAEIRDGRLEIVNANPEAGHGLGAHMVPFLEHDDPCRLLMGVNMMRQWLTPPDPEPALVQTGFEPDAPGFWCGRNLLTAFISWGIDSFEDGLVVSESAARKLNFPALLEPGDKLSNRHGSKGVVSRILPDAEMPHLQDGTPVEIVYDCMGLFSRMNFGLVRETVMGLLAHAEGAIQTVPPFRAPDENTMRSRLLKAGLPEDGQSLLRTDAAPHSSNPPELGAGGRNLDRPSTVGWVYWGKLDHLAQNKIHAAVTPGRCQRQGALEFYALKTCGAEETIREQFNTRAGERQDASTLAARVAAGPVPQAPAPSPQFADLTDRLAAAGIQVRLEQNNPNALHPPQRMQTPEHQTPEYRIPEHRTPEHQTPEHPYFHHRLAFHLAPPEGVTLTLAQPVAHPWLREHPLTVIGQCRDVPEYSAVVDANTRLARMLASQVPPTLRKKALTDLEAAIGALFDALATPEQVRFSARVLFSGRAVAANGRDLRHDQVALPEEIAWTLFGPMVTRELGAEETEARSENASSALDALMARSWVLIHRAPVVEPTGLVAFHPKRDSDRVIRISPLTNHVMNADFDGDQLAVFLPLTEAGQREAGEKLSIAAHLRRDPNLLAGFQPLHGARYGLALLGRTPDGLAEISRLAGVEVKPVDGMVGRQSILNATEQLMKADGVDAVLDALDRLIRRGFEISKVSGISMPPFMGASFVSVSQPDTDAPQAWDRYQEEVIEKLLAGRESEESDMFPFLFVTLSGARGSLSHIPRYVGAFGLVENVAGKRVPIRHSLCDGVTAEEMGIMAVGSRRGIAQAVREIEQITRILSERFRPASFNVLDRAMRSRYPGIVFARAAASQESDPLTTMESRLFVG